jgi:hypothetical protein
MVLAGGCASRNLVRLGAGSLKALVVLLVMGLAAFATMGGLLVWPAEALRGIGSLALAPEGRSLGGLLALTGVASPAVLDLALGLAMALALMLFALTDPRFRASRPDLALGFGLGTLVALGFLLTGFVLADPFEPVAVTSLTFVAPVARTLLWAMTGHGLWPGMGAALVLGTVLGAALSAGLGGRARIETFADRDDMLRHVQGGALMGFGGILALGCTIGQGMTGVATLAVGSFVALLAIVAGALLALRRLERGSWRAVIGLGTGFGADPAGRT